MSMRYGLFDSTEIVETENGYPRGNKAETADFFARYFSSFFGNGVFYAPSTNFQVLPYTGLTVQIRPGSAFINGYYCFDDSAETVTLTSDTSAHVFWLVLRLNTAAGEITKTWVTDPKAGSLPVRTATIYDLVIASVSVAANATAVTDGDITDYRSDPSCCGFVRSIYDNSSVTAGYATLAGSAQNIAEGYTVAVSKGGTGASNAESARANLGLGSAAVKDIDDYLDTESTNPVTSRKQSVMRSSQRPRCCTVSPHPLYRAVPFSVMSRHAEQRWTYRQCGI